MMYTRSVVAIRQWARGTALTRLAVGRACARHLNHVQCFSPPPRLDEWMDMRAHHCAELERRTTRRRLNRHGPHVQIVRNLHATSKLSGQIVSHKLLEIVLLNWVSSYNHSIPATRRNKRRPCDDAPASEVHAHLAMYCAMCVRALSYFLVRSRETRAVQQTTTLEWMIFIEVIFNGT